MSNEPDLSLPLTAPSMVRYREHTLNLPPTVLYTLVDLTDAELEECQRECENFTRLHSDEEDDEDDKTDKNKNDDDFNNDDGPPAPIKNIPLGYYIPIYIHSSLLEEDVVAKLEPGFKHKSPEDLACRVQAKLTPPFSTTSPTSTRDLIQQAILIHPKRCSKNKWLHKTHILVIDTANPDKNGMLMVKLPSWDGSHSETTGNTSLRGIGKGTFTTPPHIRIPYSCNDGLQTRYLILANGDADWPLESVREQPVFIVFQYDTHGKELGFCADSIDSEAAKRSPGEERLVYAPQFCREKRFVEGLDKTFFICVDGDDVNKTGLLLARRKWDGNLWDRTRDELLDLPIDDVKTVRVPVKEALAILEKGRKGETDGMSDSLKDFFL
ncbi:uncharacterized protein EAE97_011434 [Botrytis byssoidea]|uniref:Uncharacterized protein n=1 Tax=Botrytis byssoidea TaxID=139641 RepID=A0A9P5HWW7_9HELO|nr:uncharacterized protein EAE97_011434 [Botrytis byssoidea]KAF7920541.1 hypothetical protein EAE97_011434 [Botrytis byssoidea]